VGESRIGAPITTGLDASQALFPVNVTNSLLE
jgi:hypothetical protein